jgi:hypothetical protein
MQLGPELQVRGLQLTPFNLFTLNARELLEIPNWQCKAKNPNPQVLNVQI